MQTSLRLQFEQPMRSVVIFILPPLLRKARSQATPLDETKTAGRPVRGRVLAFNNLEIICRV
ncbi:hypothetical protein HMPREF3036_01596 [Sutterella sp. KLE1602]|nr:hypothetical protein HMPREF3036_01596 [Sutterella sp. KLE1602]